MLGDVTQNEYLEISAMDLKLQGKRALVTGSSIGLGEAIAHGTFSRDDFQYDPTSDVYHCPGGKRLGTSGTVHEGKTLLYRASRRDCGICPLKPQCCPKEPSRKIPRDIHEHARDVARSFAGTEGFEQSRRERKKIEMRFAHLKRILRLGRLRLRGPRGAQDEFVLAAIAQNLRRLASLVARPPPAHALCIA